MSVYELRRTPSRRRDVEAVVLITLFRHSRPYLDFAGTVEEGRLVRLSVNKVTPDVYD